MTTETPATPHKRSGGSSPKIYYTCVDAKVQGPFSMRELVRLRDAREIRGDTPVQIEGGKDWQPLETLLLHKLGRRKMKRIQRSTLTSFSRKTLPTIVFGMMGLISLLMGVGIVMRGTGESASFLGYALVGLAFTLFTIAYFIHPKSES